MATTTASDVRASRLHSPEVEEQLKPRWSDVVGKAIFAIILAVLLGISYTPAEMFNWRFFFDGQNLTNMAVFISDFLVPDFTEWDFYVEKMLETVYIAVWGTFLSIIIGVPVSLLCSTNIAPWWIVQPMRRLMDAARAINEFVFALLFVAAVGLGPFAGVLALLVHNLGVIAKLFSEAVEATDPRPVEGVWSTGATRTQEVIYGVLPQVMPIWASLSLYRFETMVRSATVLGLVGAGGIGLTLYEALRSFDYAKASAIILIIVITVSIIDVISSQLRKFLI